jgi:ADP-ribosylglycohydrolase
MFAAPVKQYTDDAAMTKCLAESLIAQEKFDALDVAKR